MNLKNKQTAYNVCQQKNWGEILLFIAFGLLSSMSSKASTYYSIASGNWSNTLVWSLSSGGSSAGVVPGVTDTVIIQGGFTITSDNIYCCKKLTIGNTGSGALTVNSGKSLTVDGAFKVISCYSVTINNTGTLAVNGDFTIYGNFWANSTGAKVILGGSSLQTIYGAVAGGSNKILSFYNLVINNPAGVKVNFISSSICTFFEFKGSDSTLQLINGVFDINQNYMVFSNATVDSYIRRTSGSIKNAYNMALDKTSGHGVHFPSGSIYAGIITTLNPANSNAFFEFATGSSSTSAGDTITIKDIWGYGKIYCDHLRVTGNINASLGQQMFYFNSLSAPYTNKNTLLIGDGSNLTNTCSSPIVSKRLVINIGTGTYTFSKSISVSDSLALVSGTMAIGTNTFTMSGNTIGRTRGSMNLSAGTLVSSNSSALSLPDSACANNQIKNWTLNGTGNINLNGNISVSGTLTLSSGTLNIGSNNLTYSGSSISLTNGNIAAGNGTLTFTNSASLILPANLFLGGFIKHLTVNGAGGITLNKNVRVSGNLALSNGIVNLNGFDFNYSGSSISRTGGSIRAGAGTISFSNSISINLQSNVFLNDSIQNLTLNGDGGLNLSGNLCIYGAITLTNGALSLGSNTLVFSGNGLSRSSGAINTGSGTITFTNASALSLPASVFLNDSVNNLTLNGAGGISLGGNLSVNGTLALNNGILNINSNNLTCNGGAITRTSGSINAKLSTISCTSSQANSFASGTFTGDSIKNLCVSGSGGITLNCPLIICTQLYLKNATLNLNNQNLTMLNGSTLMRANGNISGSPRITSGSFNVVYLGSTNISSTPELFPIGGGNIQDISLSLSSQSANISTSAGSVLLPAGNITVTSGILTLGNLCRIPVGKSIQTGANGIINTNGNLVLTGSILGSASIGNSSGVINGKVTVEDYFPAGRRAYRLLAHPFSETMTLDSILDDINITGAGGSANGFDSTVTNDPSAFTFSESGFNGTYNSGWSPFVSAHTGINSTNVVRIYYRGPRTQGNLLDGSKPVPQACTIDWSGTVNQGTIVVPLTYTNANGSNAGWNLIGNPYPSAINIGTMCAADRNNIAGFSVWVPGNGGKGSFVSYSFGSDYILPVGGAFFIQTSSAGNIIFRESMKVNQAATNALHKGAAENNSLVMELWSNDTIWWDRWELRALNTAALNFDANDFRKLDNPDVNFYSLSTDNNKLSIDSRPEFAANASVKLGMKSSSAYHFTFKVKSVKFSGSNLVLLDHFLNTQIPLVAGTSYDFVTTDDPLSSGESRFEISFSHTTTGVLEQDMQEEPFVVYPNPVVQGHIYFRSKQSLPLTYNYQLQQVSGELLLAGTMNMAEGVNLEGIPTGMYVLRILINGNWEQQKLIIAQ